MSALSPITRQTVGRTFIAAISVLGLGAAVQLGVVGWLFYARFRTTPAGESAGPPMVLAPGAQEFSDPFDDNAAPSAPPRTAGPQPPRPVPVPLAVLPPAPEITEQDRFNELVEQAKLLRQRGDTYAAVTRLREAQAMDEANPLASAELAWTYEKMGFTDRAAEAWRKVYEMGEAAGIYYAAAEGRLKASQAQALKSTQPRPAGTNATTGSAPGGETVGLGPASKLGLLDVTRKEETDPNATRKFVLHVPVKAKPRARIDVREVIVQVLFYDVINGKSLDRTTAEVSYKWTAPPADWSEGDVEQLDVSYTLPALRVADEERKYYGNIVSVYYKNALQDFRSDPPALAQRAPPPQMLAPETAE
jgi:tetratricopeptide (TPR) repeat protein